MDGRVPVKIRSGAANNYVMFKPRAVWDYELIQLFYSTQIISEFTFHVIGSQY